MNLVKCLSIIVLGFQIQISAAQKSPTYYCSFEGRFLNDKGVLDAWATRNLYLKYTKVGEFQPGLAGYLFQVLPTATGRFVRIVVKAPPGGISVTGLFFKGKGISLIGQLGGKGSKDGPYTSLGCYYQN